MEESLREIRDIGSEVKGYSYSPLALAYIGDSVFDLLVKTHIVTNANKQANKYHKEVSTFVKAKSQAMYIEILMDKLSEDEVDIFKRGRNATTHSKAKNATMSEYRKATGFEALIGYLYLNGNIARLSEILEIITKKDGENND